MQKKMVLLSGPSCVGKTPLLKALTRRHPEIVWGRPVLYTSRAPRPTERDGVDYFFRSQEEIINLPPQRFVVAKTRHIWQAIDLDEQAALFERFSLIIYDVHPALVEKLTAHPRLADAPVDIVRVFLQPATLEEIADIQQAMAASKQEATAAIMTPKLIARAQQQGKALTPKVLLDIHIRAARAWEEILIGASYDHVLINHDGENSPNWNDPIAGDAAKTLTAFVQLLIDSA